MKTILTALGIIVFALGWYMTDFSRELRKTDLESVELSERYRQLMIRLSHEANLIAETAFTPLIQWGHEITGNEQMDALENPPERFKNGLMALYHYSPEGSDVHWYTTPIPGVSEYVEKYVEIYSRYHIVDIYFTRDTLSLSSPMIIMVKNGFSDMSDLETMLFVIDYDEFMDLAVESLNLWGKTTFSWHFSPYLDIVYGIKLLKEDSTFFRCGYPDSLVNYASNIEDSWRVAQDSLFFIHYKADHYLKYGVQFPNSSIAYRFPESFNLNKRLSRAPLLPPILFTISLGLFLAARIRKKKR